VRAQPPGYGGLATPTEQLRRHPDGVAEAEGGHFHFSQLASFDCILHFHNRRLPAIVEVNHQGDAGLADGCGDLARLFQAGGHGLLQQYVPAATAMS